MKRGTEMEMRNPSNDDVVVDFSIENLTDNRFELETLNIEGAEAHLTLEKK